MKPYKILSEKGAQRLLVAIIKRAVEDYRDFEKRGMIVQGRVKKPARCRGPFVERYDCECLVKFFLPGGGMDVLIALGDLIVSGDAVRDRLGMGTSAK